MQTLAAKPRRVDNLPQSTSRGRSNSTEISQMPGDMTRALQLKKGKGLIISRGNRVSGAFINVSLLGKKCPVYGKWKEFYFVLQFKDKKLLYFEHQSVSEHLYHCDDIYLSQTHSNTGPKAYWICGSARSMRYTPVCLDRKM